MQKNLIVTIVALTILGASYFYVSGNAGSQMMKDDTMKTEDKMMEEDSMMQKPQSYLPYALGVLEANASNRRILFFYASWCPTCRPADAELSSRVGELPKGVVVIRVNYNDNDTDQAEKDLAKKYGVTYQHTYVEIDKDGNKLASWNGGAMDMLLAKLK